MARVASLFLVPGQLGAEPGPWVDRGDELAVRRYVAGKYGTAAAANAEVWILEWALSAPEWARPLLDRDSSSAPPRRRSVPGHVLYYPALGGDRC